MARSAVRLPVTISPAGRYSCQCCGVRFDWARDKPGRPPRFCSTECAAMPRLEPVECAACGDVTQKRKDREHGRRPTCSLMCRYYLTYGQWQASAWESPIAAASAKRRADAKKALDKAARGTKGRTWYVGRCRECGATVTTDQPQARTCSKRCAAKASRGRRRARKTGSFVAPVYRLAVFERDKWTCQLCGKKLKRDAAVPHPLAPTIDHIIPISHADGTHEPANCQAAHFICNARKSDGGGGEQLALVG